jgi:type II secretory pathway component PulM
MAALAVIFLALAAFWATRAIADFLFIAGAVYLAWRAHVARMAQKNAEIAKLRTQLGMVTDKVDAAPRLRAFVASPKEKQA